MIHSGSKLAWLLALWLCMPAQARAEEPSAADIDTARALGHEALDALQHADYALAEAKLDRALGLYRAPTLYLARGRARQGLGKLNAAAEDFRAVIDFPLQADENRTFQRARADAREALERVEAQLSHLTLTAASPLRRVSVNGVEWPAGALGVARSLDPGIYAIEIVAPRGATRVYHVALAAGQRQVLQLEVEDAPLAAASGETKPAPLAPPPPPAPPPPAATDHTLAYVLGATTIALVAGAIVTGIVALDRHEAYDEQNRPEVPLEEKESLRSEASTWAWINTGLWAGAIVAGGATAYVVFIAPETSTTVSGLQLVAAGRF